VAGSARDDAWGAPLENTTGSRFGFTGELTDNGLVYLRARWYNPATGTFTSRDPFPGVDTVPQSLHPYAYTHNNPVNYTDPSGKCADPVTGTVCLIGGAAAGVAASTAALFAATLLLVPATVHLYTTAPDAATNRANLARGADYVLRGGQGYTWNGPPLFSPGPAPQTRSTPPLPQPPPPLTRAPQGDATGDMAVCEPFPLPNEVSPWLQPGWGRAYPFPPVTSFPLPESRGLGVFAAQVEERYGGQEFKLVCGQACNALGEEGVNPFYHPDFRDAFPNPPIGVHVAIRNPDGTWTDRTILQNIGVYTAGNSYGYPKELEPIRKFDTFSPDIYLKLLQRLYNLPKFRN
jgi:RHS repeat-associated protein